MAEVARSGLTLLLAGLLPALPATALPLRNPVLAPDTAPPSFTAPSLAGIGDPDRDYRLALAALQAGEPAQALNALERVVLVRPDHAGAWLDLALVYLELGDPTSARAMLDHVETRFKVPEPLARRLKVLRDRLETTPVAALAPPSRWQGQWHMQLGHTSNANGGPSNTFFFLTPPNLAPVPVLLSDRQRPQSDVFAASRVEVWRDRSGEDGERRITRAQIYAREYLNEHEVTLQDLDVSETRLQPAHDGRQTFWGYGLRHARVGLAAYGSAVQVSAGQLKPVAGCQGSIRADLERRYDNRPGFSHSVMLGGQAGVNCIRDTHQAGLVLRAGVDLPDGDRPGGRQQRLELLVPARVALRERWWLDGLAGVAHVSDGDGYSPLLARNARRQVVRLQARAALQWVQRNDLLWEVAYEHLQDASNLPLFDQTTRQFSLGFRLKF